MLVAMSRQSVSGRCQRGHGFHSYIAVVVNIELITQGQSWARHHRRMECLHAVSRVWIHSE